MNESDEQFFIRLRKDKTFANEVLIFKSRELLKRAINFYCKEIGKKDDIINSIGYSIDKHLSSKDKFKVIHTIYIDSYNLSVLGIKNLFSIGSNALKEFIGALNNLLTDIEIREESKIYERSEIANLLQKVPKKTKEPLTGFQSKCTDEMIEHLFNSFSGDFIDSNTTLEQFRAIFKRSALPVGFSIEWQKSNVLLAYFIKKVFHSENWLNVWSKAEKIFTKNHKYIKNLRQSENNPFPKGYEEIDVILKSINIPSR
jgi:hypothetical protein